MRHRPVLSLGMLLSAKTRPLCAQVTVVMAAGATRDCAAASRFLFLSTVGNHGLLPLLFTPAEYPIKARARARVLNARWHCVTGETTAFLYLAARPSQPESPTVLAEAACLHGSRHCEVQHPVFTASACCALPAHLQVHAAR